jgi:phospholipid/cholesterol/gamma-HCH transport system substrate-binding protein
LLATLDSLLNQANILLASLNNQMEQGSLYNTLQNVENITNNLAVSSRDIRALTHNQLPELLTKVDGTVLELQELVGDINSAEIQQTIGNLDNTITTLNTALQSPNGTVGMLLNDKELYDNLNSALQNLDAAVMNVDTIMMAIKARPFVQKKLSKK